MKTKMALTLVVISSLILGFGSTISYAQSNPLFVQLSGATMAALYKPDSGPAPHVGVILIHRTASFMSHPGCTELPKRGFMVLCMATRFINNETLVNNEQLALDVLAGVNYLKNTQHMTKVVLFGHSGGGPTTTFYQAVAEKGPSFCTDPSKLTQCDNSSGSYSNLPKADGIVLIDGHPGGSVNALRAINPSVPVHEDSETVGLRADNDPIKVDKKLDMFDPNNGYNPTGGNSNFSKEFQKKYTAAQAERMTNWIDHALDVRAEGAGGEWRFPDDDSIIIARGGGSAAGGGAGANLIVADTGIYCCTIQPEQLMLNNGTIVKQIVQSVRLVNGTAAGIVSPQIPGNYTFDQGTKNLTVTSFLSANAIRATDSLDYSKIDWCSTNNSTPCALQNISVPILITNMGAHYFLVDGEQYYLNFAASVDKTYIVFAGLLHTIAPCTACAGGPYDNEVTLFWNYVAAWMNARF
jgi:hypothetical protein